MRHFILLATFLVVILGLLSNKCATKIQQLSKVEQLYFFHLLAASAEFSLGSQYCGDMVLKTQKEIQKQW